MTRFVPGGVTPGSCKHTGQLKGSKTNNTVLDQNVLSCFTSTCMLKWIRALLIILIIDSHANDVVVHK